MVTVIVDATVLSFENKALNTIEVSVAQQPENIKERETFSSENDT